MLQSVIGGPGGAWGSFDNLSARAGKVAEIPRFLTGQLDCLCHKKTGYLCQGLVWDFFSKPVARWQGHAGDLRRSFSPDCEDVIFSTH
jgi:hypothetical protein